MCIRDSANWEINGYGKPIYVSAGYPFKIDPPRVMGEPKACLLYTSEVEGNGMYRLYTRDEYVPAWDLKNTFGTESLFEIANSTDAVSYTHLAGTGCAGCAIGGMVSANSKGKVSAFGIFTYLCALKLTS